MSTNLVNVLVFWSLLNSWNSYSRLISFRITCFNLNSRNTTLSRNTTKKSSADQKPQSKVISIAKVQSNELLVASQQDVSCKPKSSKLWVYHITSKLVVSLSHSELQANKPVNCKPASLRAPSLQFSNF